MTSWDALCRALVYRAWDLRAGDPVAFGAACDEIYREWAAWPLVATLIERREARELMDARSRQIDDAIELVRSSYGREVRRAA